MKVQIFHLQQGARDAKGIAVLIDVFRAFSTQCYLMHYGAGQILPVADIAAAYELKKKHPEYILIGERKGKIQPGFDFGNSPYQISDADINNKTIVHTTSNGVLGISNASSASRILTGSLVNSAAIARYIKKIDPENVSLVCMGINDSIQADEDIICAQYIKSLLLDEAYDLKTEIERLKTTTGARFFDPVNADWSPEEDFYLCTKADIFDFVLEAKKDNGVLYMERIQA